MMVRRRGGDHGEGEYYKSRGSDYDRIARMSEWFQRWHPLVTLFLAIGGILGFTVITPAQSARATREELHGEIRSVAAKVDTVSAATNVRVAPLEGNQREMIEDVHIILRYLCAVGPGSVQMKRAAGLTPAKCDQ